MRVHRERLADAAFGEADVREYGIADGLMALEGVKRHRSVVADARGRIWISMNRGLSMADPARGDGRDVPALIHVEEVSADGDAARSARTRSRFPPAAAASRSPMPASACRCPNA